jgi:hypothetical protein
MTGTAGHAGVRGTTGKSLGKWYFEFNAVSAGSNDLHIGIADTTTAGVSLSYVGANANQFGLSCNGTRNELYSARVKASKLIGIITAIASHVGAASQWLQRHTELFENLG